MTEYEDWVLEKALDVWGTEAQTEQAIEEMSELITSLCHHKRDRCDSDDVAEEIADVQIILRQLALMHGEETVEEQRFEKIERLEHRLEGKR